MNYLPRLSSNAFVHAAQFDTLKFPSRHSPSSSSASDIFAFSLSSSTSRSPICARAPSRRLAACAAVRLSSSAAASFASSA